MLIALTLTLLLSGLAPPGGVVVRDAPNDGGGEIDVSWTATSDPELLSYRILRQAEGETEWDTIGLAGRLATSYSDSRVADGTRYRYIVLAMSDTASAGSVQSAYVTSSPQWFDTDRLPALVGSIICILLVVFMIQRARRNPDVFIRRISGLDAVEEALGRATEMGRPILYVPGLSTIADVATIASLNILGEVAKKTAKFGTPLTVPVRDPIVYTVAREVVKEAYTTVGRPDGFNQDMVFFVTTQQFAFAAAVNGFMVRERPATNFLIGMFWAESLLLAETGATSGAIQIAGTDALAQLPFFITACDYTLIGEELYAASAYLSREPLLLGTIKGQDYIKALILAVIIVGTALALGAGIPVQRIF